MKIAEKIAYQMPILTA